MPTLSIEIPADAVPRIKAVLRDRFPIGIDPETGVDYPEPTNAELLAALKGDVREFVKRTVREFESREAQEQARAAITDIDVS